MIERLPKAEGNLKLGPIQLHPAISITEKWNDNIYFDIKDKKEDYISTITGGMLLSLGQEFSFNIGYLVDYHFYSKNKKESFLSHNSFVEMDMNYPSGFKVYGSNKNIVTYDPRDAPDNPLRAKRMTNTAKGQIGYKSTSDKTKIGLYYTNENLDYFSKHNNIFDRQKHIGNSLISYYFSPKTALEIEYQFLWEEYKNRDISNIDSKNHTGYGGFSWSDENIYKILLKYGKQWIKYDNEDLTDEMIDVFKTSIDYKFGLFGKTDLMFSGNHSVVNTPYNGNIILELSPASYYLSTNLKVKLLSNFTSKVRFYVHYNYEMRDYGVLDKNFSARSDKIQRMGAGLSVKPIGIILLSIQYDSTKNKSNDKDRNLVNNTAFFNISVAL
ncbi:MAG: outer membrane beta-barrel protein [Spirochaetia bacterium]|nr:outer membrane beta-barrel protein [Spirochaetia bacterium]